MAHRWWGLNRGQYYTDVVEQSTDPSKNISVDLDLTANMTKEDVIVALEQIRIAIIEDKWPPA